MRKLIILLASIMLFMIAYLLDGELENALAQCGAGSFCGIDQGYKATVNVNAKECFRNGTTWQCSSNGLWICNGRYACTLSGGNSQCSFSGSVNNCTMTVSAKSSCNSDSCYNDCDINTDLDTCDRIRSPVNTGCCVIGFTPTPTPGGGGGGGTPAPYPSCSFTSGVTGSMGSLTVLTGSSLSWTATCNVSSGSISQTRIFSKRETSPMDWTTGWNTTSCAGNTCSDTRTFNQAGTYWVTLDGTTNASKICSGNPGCEWEPLPNVLNCAGDYQAQDCNGLAGDWAQIIVVTPSPTPTPTPPAGCTPPPAPSLTGPANGATIDCSGSTTFSWSSSTGADSYKFRLDNSTDNGWLGCPNTNPGDYCVNNILQTSRTASQMGVNLLAGKSYRWWVFAHEDSRRQQWTI